MRKLKYFILALTWMGIIFYFSSQVGLKSSENNHLFIISLQSIGIDITKVLGVDFANFIVRKLAHVSEYTILFFLVYFGFLKSKVKLAVIYSSIISILYAVLDEIHQLYVPGREGKIRDVLIDSIGVLIGIVIIFCFRKIISNATDP